jgi:heme-degrading monooxygenase HmoA
MFDPITVPFDVVMLFSVVKLKEDVDMDEIELALGKICNVVKNTYGDDEGGFIGGQCFRYAGFVSAEGTLGSSKTTDDHLAIVTYWKSFDQHENSHADQVFKEKFSMLEEYCDETYEIGYELMWQGAPE